MVNSQKARINYVDYVKGIGILLIILAHCWQWIPTMKYGVNFIKGFHVPLFFMIAGILENNLETRRVSFVKFLSKRAQTLLIPYIIFSLINSTLKLGTLFIAGRLSSNVIYAELLELLVTGNGTVWFCVTFFAMDLIMFFFKKINIVAWFTITLFGLFVPYMIGEAQSPFLIVIVRIVGACGYYAVGVLIQKFIIEKNYSEKKIIAIGGGHLW